MRSRERLSPAARFQQVRASDSVRSRGSLSTDRCTFCTVPTPESPSSDARDVHLHHGSWVLKFTAWALCNVLPFFASNGVVGAYTWVARVASGVFLVVQMIILLDFAFFWNESWVARQHAGWLVGLLVSTIVLYAESVAVGIADVCVAVGWVRRARWGAIPIAVSYPDGS